jgi:hypothetical protein
MNGHRSFSSNDSQDASFKKFKQYLEVPNEHLSELRSLIFSPLMHYKDLNLNDYLLLVQLQLKMGFRNERKLRIILRKRLLDCG